MKLKLVTALILAYPLTLLVVKPHQVRTGTREYQLFEQISAEMNSEMKIKLITSFEKESRSRRFSRVSILWR